MAKEMTLTIWLHHDTARYASSLISDAINDVLRHPDIYPLIDDIDDEGWSWYGPAD